MQCPTHDSWEISGLLELINLGGKNKRHVFSEQESIKSLIVETIGKYILVSQANQWKLKRTFRQYSSFSSFVQRVFTKFVSLFVLRKINCKQKKK